jgi:hypothetical protein
LTGKKLFFRRFVLNLSHDFSSAKCIGKLGVEKQVFQFASATGAGSSLKKIFYRFELRDLKAKNFKCYFKLY